MVNKMNLKDYQVTENNIDQLVNVDKGYILNPFIGYKGWSKISSLCNPILPNIEINAKFYRPKSLHKSKVLHATDELEIVDVSLFKDEVAAVNGTIEQYISDGEIITELSYHVKETKEVFLKRALKELEASYLFYSKQGYEKRFYIEGMEDTQREEFTKIVLNNALIIINHLKGFKGERHGKSTF